MRVVALGRSELATQSVQAGLQVIASAAAAVWRHVRQEPLQVSDLGADLRDRARLTVTVHDAPGRGMGGGLAVWLGPDRARGYDPGER